MPYVSSIVQPDRLTFLDGITLGAKATVDVVASSPATLTLTTEIEGTDARVKLTGLDDPVDVHDAVHLGYLQAQLTHVRQGLSWQTPVRLAPVGSVDLAFPPLAIDGVVPVPGDRVLLKEQTDATENGIYVVGDAGLVVRVSVDDPMADGNGANQAVCFVREGQAHADQAYVCTSDAGSDTVGVHALAFALFSHVGQIDVAADSGLGRTATSLFVAPSGITAAMLQDACVSTVAVDSIDVSKLTGTVSPHTPGATGLHLPAAVVLTDRTERQTLAGGFAVADAADVSGTVADGDLTAAVEVVGGLAVRKRAHVEGDFQCNGHVRARTVTSFSDRTLKRDIRPIEGAAGAVLRLAPVTFQWRGRRGPRAAGLVAQEVERVLPDAVHTDATTGTKSVDYDHVWTHLLALVQRLHARVAELENRAGV